MQRQRRVWSNPSLHPRGTVVLDTLTFQANEHPPLATSPYQVGPSASSANCTGQKPYAAVYP